MANTAQAKKRARQAEKHRQHNMGLRSQLRTAIKKVLAAVTAKDKQAANDSLKQAKPIIDKMVNKKIVHKNTAGRYKSRINAKVKGLA